MREALGEDIEPRLRGLLQGHAEASSLNGDGFPRRHAARPVEHIETETTPDVGVTKRVAPRRRTAKPRE